MKKVTLIVTLLLGVIMSCTFAQKKVVFAPRERWSILQTAVLKTDGTGGIDSTSQSDFIGDRASLLALFPEQFIQQPKDLKKVRLVGLQGETTSLQSSTVTHKMRVTTFKQTKKGLWMSTGSEREELAAVPVTPTKEILATVAAANK